MHRLVLRQVQSLKTIHCVENDMKITITGEITQRYQKEHNNTKKTTLLMNEIVKTLQYAKQYKLARMVIAYLSKQICLHHIKLPHPVGKLLLNLTLGEEVALLWQPDRVVCLVDRCPSSWCP